MGFCHKIKSDIFLFSSLLSSVIDILNVQYFRFTQSYENSIKKCLDERNTHAKYECHMSYGKKVLWRVKVLVE